MKSMVSERSHATRICLSTLSVCKHQVAKKGVLIRGEVIMKNFYKSMAVLTQRFLKAENFSMGLSESLD